VITPDRHQPRLATQTENVVEQLGDVGFMAAAELRDRRVIRHPLAGDHLARDVLLTSPLDPT
jgi:hypothetical protein